MSPYIFSSKALCSLVMFIVVTLWSPKISDIDYRSTTIWGLASGAPLGVSQLAFPSALRPSGWLASFGLPALSPNSHGPLFPLMYYDSTYRLNKSSFREFPSHCGRSEREDSVSVSRIYFFLLFFSLSVIVHGGCLQELRFTSGCEILQHSISLSDPAK